MMAQGDAHVASNRPNSRPTIGLAFVTTLGVGKYYYDLWTGVVDRARELDANLICFPGGTLNFPPVQNAVFRLLTSDNVDGLIIMSAVGNRVSQDEFLRFVDRYRPLPMVSIGLVQDGIPHVVIDNQKGLRDVLAHLIGIHGHQRIAFIRGPQTNSDAEERYRTYEQVLAEYGIPVDPSLVTRGTFLPDAGVETVRLLLDERRVGFDAIVAANDNMAIGALEELQARGIRVPTDVAVTGFDDLESAAALIPPLTTVRQPVYEQGRLATEILLERLAGAKVSQETVLPTELIVRRSCGCMLPAVTRAQAGRIAAVGRESDVSLSLQSGRILTGVLQDLTNQAWAKPEKVRRLLEAFVSELDTRQPGIFVSTLEDIVGQTAAQEEIAVWQEALSSTRQHALPYLAGEALLKAEDLWHQARVFVGDLARRVAMRETLTSEQHSAELRRFGQELDVASDLTELLQILGEQLPKVGVTSGYVALYDEDTLAPGQAEPTELSRLVLAYDEEGHVEVDADGQFFPSRKLLPPGMLHSEGQFTMVVGNLFVREGLQGFALFKMGPRDGLLYYSLEEQISSALHRIRLVGQIGERSEALQEANYALQRRAIQIEASAQIGQAITSIFDVKELLRRTTELISERFGFYHVGIFLLDSSEGWLVLQEATGEAGAEMKARGHRLSVGDTSMVGWTAAHRQPRIALDVGEDAVHFAHPLLSHTRSEMTLPLLIGDRLVGVLDVQSIDEAAFDRDDVRTLQSMADQIAVAIENAHQVSDETALLEATSPIYRASRLLTTATTTADVADAIIASVAETGADGCTVVGFEFLTGGEPDALLYLGVWRRDREPQFQPGLRLPIDESPFPLEMVSTLWSVADVDNDERLPRSARVVFQSTGAKALVNIPLRSGDRVIGQVVVIRATPGPFADAALRLYEVLSDQAAVALERAQLLEKLQKNAGREQQTRQMIDRIRRAVDVEQALWAAAEELSRAMGVPHVSVDLSLEALQDQPITE
jgi:DNA-binding LacI/PurR family transcriptional regulator/GAF domain-containing protein